MNHPSSTKVEALLTQTKPKSISKLFFAGLFRFSIFAKYFSLNVLECFSIVFFPTETKYSFFSIHETFAKLPTLAFYVFYSFQPFYQSFFLLCFACRHWNSIQAFVIRLTRMCIEERHSVRQLRTYEVLIAVVKSLTAHCASVVAKVVLDRRCFHLEEIEIEFWVCFFIKVFSTICWACVIMGIYAR